MSVKTIKALYKDDIRRLSINIEQIGYESLRKKLQSTFQLDNEFTIKYTDTDGDFCTIGGREELDDLVESDIVKQKQGTLRLHVVPSNSSILSPSFFHPQEISDGSQRPRPRIESDLTDAGMLEILRDIGLYIHARESAMADLPPGASSWVSTEKNLITPSSAENFQRLCYASGIRRKLSPSSAESLLNGLDGHVHRWSVDTVAEWLTRSGFEENVAAFRANDISGDVLLELTHDTLKDMGMNSTGKRIRLLKMIAELRFHVADLAMQESTSKLAKEGPNGEPLLEEPRVFGGMAIH
ncbi:polar growth protein [Actinomortierella wolfii]|nr:polar growth protein [Actinomortierella wolfii]